MERKRASAGRKPSASLYTFLLGFIALLAIFAYLGIQELAAVQERTASALNTYNDQRKLTQSIALAAIRLSTTRDAAEHQTLRKSLEELLTRMDGMRTQTLNGADYNRVFGRTAPSLRQMYAAPPAYLNQHIQNFLIQINGILSTVNAAAPPNPANVDFLLNTDKELSAAFDEAIGQYEYEARAAITRLQAAELLILASILVALFLEARGIFFPMVRRVEKETQKLAHSQKMLDSVLDTVGEAIVTVDINNTIVRINQEVQNIWGYEQAEIRGEKLHRLFSPRFRASHSDASDIGNLGRRFEIEGLKKDGTVFPLEIRTTKSMTDDQVLFTTAMRDITERKAAEQRIHHQLETIKALYNSAQKLSESLDLNALATDVTRTCVKEFGAQHAWLGRAESDGRVIPFAHYPADINYPLQISVRWDDPEQPEAQGPTGRAIRTGVPVVMHNLADDPAFTPWREAAIAQGFRSGAAFPLISRDRPFGALNLYSDDVGFFTPERIEFFQNYAHQAAAALENARLFADDRQRLEKLQALRSVDIAITSSPDLRVTFDVLLDQVVTKLSVDAACMLLLNPQAQTLEHRVNRGFRYNHVMRSRLRLGRGHAGLAAMERQIICIPNLNEAADDEARMPLLAGEGFVTYYAVPLIAKGHVKGVLEIFHRSLLNPDPDWMGFLEALAAQAAIAIDNAELFERLQRTNLELMMAYDDTLEGWSRALDMRDHETEGHTARVTELAVRLARAMSVSDEELIHVYRGGLLHDIGKMGIPDEILLKPGPLTEEEWKTMRKHPTYALDMLLPIQYLRPAIDIPLCHHEKWDGTGYPRGLKGDQIPLAARIFAVVDVWDALTSDRPYHKAWAFEKARNHILALSGSHFDPRVVEAFMRLIGGNDQSDSHEKPIRIEMQPIRRSGQSNNAMRISVPLGLF